MNNIPLTGNNFEYADKYNKQFCKSIPKGDQKDIIVEWEKLRGNDFVKCVKNLPQEDIDFITCAEVNRHIAQIIPLKESSHTTKTRICICKLL